MGGGFPGIARLPRSLTPWPPLRVAERGTPGSPPIPSSRGSGASEGSGWNPDELGRIHPIKVDSSAEVDWSAFFGGVNRLQTKEVIRSLRMTMAAKGATTRPGYVNRNNQIVVRSTGMPGNDHLQIVYVLRCRACETEYGANGSDVWQRKCPSCQGGMPGLKY